MELKKEISLLWAAIILNGLMTLSGIYFHGQYVRASARADAELATLKIQDELRERIGKLELNVAKITK